MKRLLLGLAAFALAGCAMDTTETDLAQCAAWGAPAGHSDHAYCMSSRAQVHAANQQAFAARLAAAGAAMSRASAASQSTSGQSRSLAPMEPMTTTCMSRGEATSGMNKICYYDCLGSAAAVTQSAVSLCPLSIRR